MRYFATFVNLYWCYLIISWYIHILSDHVEYLSSILQLSKHKLYANLKKCSFAQRSCIPWAVVLDLFKVKLCLTGQNLITLRNYELGLTGSYINKICKSLCWNSTTYNRAVGKKIDLGVWPEQFLHSKLLNYDHGPSTKTFCFWHALEKDVSGYDVGAVLMQGKQQIAFYTQVLGQQAPMNPIYKKQLMATVCYYLLGIRFVSVPT